MISIILTVVFLSLALIHFNWVRGGTWGFDNALPANEKGDRLFTPLKIHSFIVGIGLLGFSFFYIHISKIVTIPLPEPASTYIEWVIPSIFILRAIGDFRYVGLFKKVKNTNFAQYDTKYFTPLCITIGVLGYIDAFG